MQHPTRPWRVTLIGSLAVGMILSLNGVGLAGTPHGAHGAGARQQARNVYLHTRGGGPTAQSHARRRRPGRSVRAVRRRADRAGGSRVRAGAGQRPAAGRGAAGDRPAWQEFTSEPYNAQPSNYTDPFWSQREAPASRSSAAGPRRWPPRRTAPGSPAPPTAACGGPATRASTGRRCSTRCRRCPSGRWRSTRWTGRCGSAPARRTCRRTPTRAPGCTGRPTTARPSARVGDDSSGNNPLVSHTVFRIAFDPSGNAYAATDNGLFRLRGQRRLVDRGAGPGRPDRLPAVRPAGDRRRCPARLGRARSSSPRSAGTGRATPQNNGFYAVDRRRSHLQPRSPRPATSTPATSAGPRSRTPPTAPSSTRSCSRPATQAAGEESVLQGIFVSSGQPGQPDRAMDQDRRRGQAGRLRLGAGRRDPATASACRPGTTRTWRWTPATRTTCTPGWRRSSSPPTPAAPG